MLQLAASPVAQRADLVRQGFTRDIVKRFAKDVRLPYPVDVSVKALKQKVDDVCHNGDLSDLLDATKELGDAKK